MDNLLTLLFSLLRIADLSHGDESILTLASMNDIIADVLSEALSEEERQHVMDTLLEVSGNDISAASAIERINNIAHMLRVKGVNSERFRTRSISINKILDDLLALCSIISSRSIGHVDVTITNIDLFNYIQKIHIEPENDRPYIVVIGAVSKQHDMLINLGNNSYIERKTKIIHDRTSPYPRLNLTTPSKRPSSNWRHRRFDWLQRGSAEDDLDVYTYQERWVGSISTRELGLPYTISGKRLNFIIPEQAGTTLLATSIRNEKGTALMHCIRVRKPSDTPAPQVS